MSKVKLNDVKKEEPLELETQFIMRMPEEPAKLLHELVQSGSNTLKDRLEIKLEADLRYGEVRFDHWLLHAKVVDLPTVIESLKTIDNKSFYKTADICQIMICKEEPDPPEEEESPNKAKKKDPNKVDKKYLWPHGITPPCKNVRKRRFRKTLKKKFVEAPEIEKEVKRLLRIDNDAVSVKYDIINEDEEDIKSDNLDTSKSQTQNDTDEEKQDELFGEMLEKELAGDSDGDNEQHQQNDMPLRGLGEHDIFGGEVSSSDDEDNRNSPQNQENSGFDEDSRLSDFSMPGGGGGGGGDATNNKDKVTEFTKSMFSPKKEPNETGNGGGGDTGHAGGPSGFYEQQKSQDSDDYDFSEPQMTKEQLNAKILSLRKQCDDLKFQQHQKSMEINSIQNQTLKQRLLEAVANLLNQIMEKELEIQEYQNMLQAKGSN